MSRGTEQQAAVPLADGTIKKLRNIEYKVVNADGSESTVQAEVIVQADANGDIVNPCFDEILVALDKMNVTLELMMSYLQQLAGSDLRHSVAGSKTDKYTNSAKVIKTSLKDS